MKYCSKCGRELFDRDIECDKCKSTDFISEKKCKEIVEKINSVNMISKKKLLKDPIYKMVYDFIINKPRDSFNPYATDGNSESNKEYFDRISKHTINKPEKQNVPKCPTCGSTNIRRMSGVECGASIAAFGIFSKKINKTFKCGNCGYTW